MCYNLLKLLDFSCMSMIIVEVNDPAEPVAVCWARVPDGEHTKIRTINIGAAALAQSETETTVSVNSTPPLQGRRYFSAARLTFVNSEISRRARRLSYLRPDLLAEPAWDILLHVYAFELVRRRVTASELVEKINVPSTTSIRWMKVLEADGLIERVIVADDPAQVTVSLTMKGLEAMDGYFSESP